MKALPLPLLAALLPTSALAQTAEPAPATYALSWVRAEGAEACPAAPVLAAEVERRLGRPVFDLKAERSIEIDVTRFADKYRSDVYVRDASGKTLGHRQLESDEPGCGALLSATVLAVALVIDPDAASREPAAAPATASFESPPVASAPAPRAAPVASSPPPKTAPARSRPSLAADDVTHRAAFADIALGVTYNLGLVPSASVGAELAFAARPWGRWGYALAADYVSSQRATRGIGSLDLGLTRGSALLLYYVAYRSSRVWLGAGPTLGAFHVGVRTPTPITDAGDFLFAAAAARANAQVPVSTKFYLHFALTGVVAPWRQEFLVRKQVEPVWRQPVLAGSGFFGLGMAFP